MIGLPPVGRELQIVPAVAPLSRVYDAAVHDAGEFDAGTPQGENVVDGLVDDQVCARGESGV